MRKFLMIVLSILVIIAIVTTVITALYLLILSGGIFSFMPNPPEPEITYGEFPFRVTYELNGEFKEISDIIICEFDGFENRGSGGTHRKWKTTLKSGNENITLLHINNLDVKTEFNQEILELFFYYGTGAYYMGDVENTSAREAQSLDWVEYKYKTKDGKIGSSGYKADEAFEKFKIRLISWECAPPIENSFN